MLLTDARRAARTDAAGELVLLADQDRTLWDRERIEEGLGLVAEARPWGPRPYLLPAAFGAEHCRAARAEDTDWERIARLYAWLAAIDRSPVVELNRAVAVAMADGPAAGLALVDALTSEPRLAGYHLLPSVRGDLLVKLGRHGEARAEFERAASLTRNARERELLLGRAAECAGAGR
jgi:predicted RNA polymerase sigma factor